MLHLTNTWCRTLQNSDGYVPGDASSFMCSCGFSSLATLELVLHCLKLG